MAEQSLKQKTMNGVVWNIFNTIANKVIVFVFSILLARLLSPEDYGTVAMLNIFIAISQTFIDSGLRTALIRKQDRTEEDNNTMFYFNLVTALFFYAVLFFAAPYIADFYNTPILKDVARVSGLILVIPTLSGVQGALLTARVDFKTMSIYGLISALTASCFGLWMAYSGYGVWSLVLQQLLASVLSVIFIDIKVKWRPRLIFSWKSFREMFGYGSKLLATSLLDTTYENLNTMVIGKMFTPSQLGYYSKANTFSNLPSKTVTGVIFSVSFPVLCTIQDDKEQSRKYFRSFLLLTEYIVLPLMIGMIAVAEPMTMALLTEKWMPIVPYLRILCLGFMWVPMMWYNNGYLKVSGYSGMVLKLEIIKKIIGVAVLIVTANISVLAMSIGASVMILISIPLDSIYSKRLLDYSLLKQMKDLLHIFLTALIMGIGAYFICRYIKSSVLALIVSISASGCFYFGVSYFFKFEELSTLTRLITDKLHGRN